MRKGAGIVEGLAGGGRGSGGGFKSAPGSCQCAGGFA